MAGDTPKKIRELKAKIAAIEGKEAKKSTTQRRKRGATKAEQELGISSEFATKRAKTAKAVYDGTSGLLKKDGEDLVEVMKSGVTSVP